MTTTVTTPTKDMPCTISIGSDRYAARVVEILSPKRIRVKWGFKEEAAKKYNEEYEGEIWSLRKDGRWRPKGTSFNSGYGISFGHAEDYRDPSF